MYRESTKKTKIKFKSHLISFVSVDLTIFFCAVSSQTVCHSISILPLICFSCEHLLPSQQIPINCRLDSGVVGWQLAYAVEYQIAAGIVVFATETAVVVCEETLLLLLIELLNLWDNVVEWYLKMLPEYEKNMRENLALVQKTKNIKIYVILCKFMFHKECKAIFSVTLFFLS